MVKWSSLLCTLGIFAFFASCSSVTTKTRGTTPVDTRTSLTLLPPSPITNQVTLDIRGGIWNEGDKSKEYQITVYVDEVSNDKKIFSETRTIAPGKSDGIKINLNTADMGGTRKIIFDVECNKEKWQKIESVTIIPSDIRSTRMIDGAWFEFYHWCENEGRLWNKDIIKLTDNQWKEMVRGMHELNMNVVVIQELFRNEKYVGKHNMDSTGYTGYAYYESDLYPRQDSDSIFLHTNFGETSPNKPAYPHLIAQAPLDAVLEEAERLDMKIFLGIGGYAWFDFSEGSLKWSKEVAQELWNKYGHYKSFYGWYISNEIFGNLGMEDHQKDEIVHFFEEFTPFVKQLAPDKPVMLASNCHDIKGARDYYPKLLRNLDILCPFGFHRMPEGDYTGKEAAAILQSYCDAAGSHLWMDMEIFLFGDKNSLYPRPIEQVIRDLNVFDNFEKVFCYSYTGLLNAPWQTAHPGGEETVKLYNDYLNYLENDWKKTYFTFKE